MSSVTFPSGRIQKTAYDSANRINNVQDSYNSNTSTHASSIGYAPNGTLDSMVIGHLTSSGNTMTENTTLNTLWQITNRNLQIGSAFPVTLGFTYGVAAKNNGNLTQQMIVTTAAPNPPPGVSIPGGFDSWSATPSFTTHVLNPTVTTAAYEPEEFMAGLVTVSTTPFSQEGTTVVPGCTFSSSPIARPSRLQVAQSGALYLTI